jgi:hypothetical protein
VASTPYIEAGAATKVIEDDKPIVPQAIHITAPLVHQPKVQITSWHSLPLPPWFIPSRAITVIKDVFHYLTSTKIRALMNGNEHHDLFADADNASQEPRRFISGFAFLTDGATISWTLHKPELVTKPVTLSTVKAEHIAATHTGLCRLIHPLFSPAPMPTILLCDNRTTSPLVTSIDHHAHAQHIDIQFPCQSTTNNCTDTTICCSPTKALPKQQVALHSLDLRIRHA